MRIDAATHPRSRHAHRSGVLRPAALFAAVLLSARTAAAEGAAPPADVGAPHGKNEVVVVPDFGGNSDTGIEVGGAALWIRLKDGYRPYRFRVDTVLSTSFKAEDGLKLVQHKYTFRFDVPGLLGGRVRADTRIGYLRQVDMPWYGAGNATTESPGTDPEKAYEYKEQNLRLRSLVRVRVAQGLDLAFMPHIRYEAPSAYQGTRLLSEIDSGAEVGTTHTVLASVAAGIMYDTRDSEFVTTRGAFYQIGFAPTVGTADDVRFGEASAVLSHYAPLTRWLSFASRMYGSFKFGKIPFYDLQQGGVFDPIYMVGGYRGVRGVRLGRYAGAVKLVTNAELRFFPFEAVRILSRPVRVGFDGFFDAGRVFRDYAFSSPEDGRKVGIHWGAGGGVILQIESASIFRAELAYSPQVDADSAPVAFYLENGLAF